MTGIQMVIGDDLQIRAAALELAVGAYQPDEVMVSAPGFRTLPVAEEILETAKAFEAYLRGAGAAVAGDG